jgi:(S)-ureidoglycine aminohydrolase
MKPIFFSLLLFGLIETSAQNFSEVKSQVIHWDSLKAKTENGKTRRFLVEGNTTFLKYFRVHATTIEPGMAPNPPHPNKDADELFIVKEGKIRVTINNKSKDLEAGGVAVVLADEVHGILNVGSTPATYYVLRYQSKQGTDLTRGQTSGGSILLNKDECPPKEHSKGIRRDFYNRPTSQCSVFEMHTTALNSGQESHQQHTHAAEEIILVTKGTVTELIDCQLHQAKAGDLIFLGSNVPHALINTSGTQCEYFAFTWK